MKECRWCSNFVGVNSLLLIIGKRGIFCGDGVDLIIWYIQEYGGRWKPLHYFAVEFFAPLAVFPLELEDQSIASFVHFDRIEDLQSGNLQIFVHSWQQLDPLLQIDVPIYKVNFKNQHFQKRVLIFIWMTCIECQCRRGCLEATAWSSVQSNWLHQRDMFHQQFTHWPSIRARFGAP